MLRVSFRSHAGTVRAINEDFVLWEPEVGLLAVADGMGGHNAGEIASKLALEGVRGFLRRSATSDFTWPFGVQPALSFAANRLMTAIKIANRAVYREAEQRAEYTGMGTTVVAVMPEAATLTYASVGDSRIYSFDGTSLQQLTRDDSWVVMLMEEGGLDPAAAERHPMRHVLTSVVGARPDLDVVAREIQLVDGQTILLSTDGLHRGVGDAGMVEILRGEPELDRAAQALIEAALSRDGSDNITLALARYSAD